MELYITSSGRMNFTQMAMYGRSCGSRFRQNFKTPFDWIVFNKHFVDIQSRDRIAIAIDPCFIPKSGKKTPGLGWLWSVYATAMKRGLEPIMISVIDADTKDVVFLKAEQAVTEKRRGRKHVCAKGIMEPDSLTGWYLRMLARNAKRLLSACNTVVADTHLSKESPVSRVVSLEFNIISCFRDGINLKYVYRGPKTSGKGRPQKFTGKVNLADLNMNVFREETSTDDNQTCRLYTADVWAVSLGREARVVIVDYIDNGKKRQIRKVFFCTDLTKFVEDIFDIYRTRFQPEYVFRDAKQFTELKHCQTINKEAISFAFNASLLSVNLARAYARKEGDSLSVGVTKTLMLNAVMLERFHSMSAKQADRR